MINSNSKEDAFHQLVFGMTGKDHVSELSDAEKAAVQKELLERMKLKNHIEPLKKKSKPPEDVPRMITPAQRGNARDLRELQPHIDTAPVAADGIIPLSLLSEVYQ